MGRIRLQGGKVIQLVELRQPKWTHIDFFKWDGLSKYPVARGLNSLGQGSTGVWKSRLALPCLIFVGACKSELAVVLCRIK